MNTFNCPYCNGLTVDYIYANDPVDGGKGRQLVRCSNCDKHFWVMYRVHFDFEVQTEEEVREAYDRVGLDYDHDLELQLMDGNGL